VIFNIVQSSALLYRLVQCWTFESLQHFPFVAVGMDFTEVCQNLTFSSDDTQQNISIDILDDDITEGNESFTVTLSAIPFDEDQSAVALVQHVMLETNFSTVTINIVDDQLLSKEVPNSQLRFCIPMVGHALAANVSQPS